MQYSFEPGERAALELYCERIPAGLKIGVRDQGLPFGGPGPVPADEGGLKNAAPNLRDCFDEILFNNLGPAGKEFVFVKHLGQRALADDEAVCRFEPSDAAQPTQPLPQAASRCTVRPMAPADAPEISKLVYRTYGYSYSHDYIYYPEKILALNASGEVQSALAVTERNEIVGHCALSLWSGNPQIAELGQGVVVPSHRSQGCFAKLTEYLIDAGRRRGLKGVFSEAVTVHPFSQKAALQQGLRDCALFLCLLSPAVRFKGFENGPSGRGSMLLQFKYLDPPPVRTVYAPARHADMLRAIYAHLAPSAVPRMPKPPEAPAEEGKPVYKINLVRSLNFARIRIDGYGAGIVDEIRIVLRELCRQRWDVIHLVLNLSDPQTALFCGRFEALGFFFAGLLPLGHPAGDALILQYPNSVCARYERIQTAGRFASELAAYVRSCDPDPASIQAAPG
jgi:serine/threonine-protein kinase RsbW